MAGILERCKDILESNVHALLDKCENPEKMLDQELRKATRQLAEIKDATASVMADEKAAQREYDDALKQADGEHAAAANALRAGDEVAARKFLASEQSIREGRLAIAAKTLEAARNNTQMMKDAHNKLADDVEWMRSQLTTIKGTIKVAKATETVGKVKANKKDTTAAFGKYAGKAQRMLDEAQAKAELSQEPKDDLDELRAKYASVGGTSVDDALAKLRAETGVGADPLDALKSETGGSGEGN